MRKTNDAKKVKKVKFAKIDGYHGREWGSERYAFNGFKRRLYFTSDRYIPLDELFRRPDGQPLKGFGLEIESECWGVHSQQALAEILDKVIFPAFPADLFKMQEDGSLSGGYSQSENITQVMTREFIRNNYGAFKLMYDSYFPQFEISCSRSGNCGMHVNISNAVFGKTPEAQALALRKMYYIVNKYYKTICRATGRDLSDTHYYARLDPARAKDGTDVRLLGQGHGVCFNTAHYDTGRVELRFPGGQRDFESFRGTMELVFWLCGRVKGISWEDCESIDKVFAGCNQYVVSALRKACDAGHLTLERYFAIVDASTIEDFEVEIVEEV